MLLEEIIIANFLELTTNGCFHKVLHLKKQSTDGLLTSSILIKMVCRCAVLYLDEVFNCAKDFWS